MYLNHFGLDEPPFRITPHTDFFFGGANRGATLEALLYAITHDEGIVKVSGEVGSGKTMLCRVLMERLPQQVRTILLSNPSLSRDEIIHAIAEELEIGQQSERPSALLLRLQEHLVTLYGENQRVVLLIDEAHAMPQETLEQIRLLSNIESSHSKLLQIVLFGQPELDEHLNLPHMRQLKERITHNFRLEPLLRSDIEDYLDFRLRAAGYRGPKLFAPKAVRRIVKASEGLTRRVNILADKSLLAAFADNEHGICARHVNRAIRDSEFGRRAAGSSKTGLAAGGVAAGLALGLGVHFLLAPSTLIADAQTAVLGMLGLTPANIGASEGRPMMVPLGAPRAPSPADAPPVAASAITATPLLPGASPAPGLTPMAPSVVEPATPATATTPAARVAPAAPAALASSASPATLATPATTPTASTAPTPAARPTTPVTRAATVGPLAPIAQQPSAAPVTARTARAPAAQSAAVDTVIAARVPATVTATAEPELSAVTKPESEPHVPPAPPTGRLTRERFAATQEWLRSARGNQYSVQLLVAGTQDLHRIEVLLARASSANLNLSDFYVYSVKIDDQQHYRLAYGLYPTQAAANKEIEKLPSIYTVFVPFPRSVDRMRKHNRQ